jgi:dihydroorotase (multifunctional complex type)
VIQLAEVDIAVKKVRIVFPGQEVTGNLYVKDGVVAGIGTFELSATKQIDATGLLLLPGMIDAHVHFMDPGETSREDFPSGSAAAAVAGVTTVLEHSHNHPVYDGISFREKREYLKDRSVVDFGLAAHFSNRRIQDILDVLDEGAAFIKVFTCDTHGIEAVSNGKLLEAMSKANQARGVFLVHAEDDSLTKHAERSLKDSDRNDGAVIPEWRSVLAEQIAVETVCRLVLTTDARVIIAHCSHPEIINIINRYRCLGADVSAECCPQYLHLFKDAVNEKKGFRKFTPPARARSVQELEEMWVRIRNGKIHYLASDHAPSTKKQKESGSIWEVPFGLPGIDTTLPIMINAVNEGKLSWRRLVEMYSEMPAKLYGLYPRKGSLQIGSDADFVLIDPNPSYTLKDDLILSKAGWTPYSERVLTGRVVATYLRGQKIAEDHRCLAPPGTGLFVKRKQINF